MMTDKDKLLAIEAEIESRKKEVIDNIFELGNSESERIGLFDRKEIYEDLLSFIDSMKKEQTTSVWHDATEEPKYKTECLVIGKRGSKDVATYGNGFFHKGHVICEPCRLFHISDVVKWAYVSELFHL